MDSVVSSQDWMTVEDKKKKKKPWAKHLLRQELTVGTRGPLCRFQLVPLLPGGKETSLSFLVDLPVLGTMSLDSLLEFVESRSKLAYFVTWEQI